MLITNIEIGTINGEVVEVAINVVINSQWRAAAHGIGRHAGQRSCGGSQWWYEHDCDRVPIPVEV